MQLQAQEWSRTSSMSLELFTPSDLAALQAYGQKSHYFDVEYSVNRVCLVVKQHVGQCVISLPDYGPLQLEVSPKVSIACLMQWWCDSAYLLDSLPQVLPLESVTDLLDQLAYWLAEQVLMLARKGYISAYQKKRAALVSPKGKIHCLSTAQALAQGKAKVDCEFFERTQDIEENRILLWTLDCLRRAPLVNTDARNKVIAAWRAMQGVATMSQVTTKQIAAVEYNRLNLHYQLAHQLCWMLLSGLSVSERSGSQQIASFMLPMNVVFEAAVANALAEQLKNKLQIVPQEYHSFSSCPDVSSRIDIVIRFLNGEALAVMDTKYKHGDNPSNSDIYQVVAYATALGCDQAWLLYPSVLKTPLDTYLGNVSCKSIGVPMNQSPLVAVENLLGQLLKFKPNGEN